MRRFTMASLRGAASLLAVCALAPLSWAVNGTWNSATSGDWDTAGNWVGSTIADGASSTANFTQPDLAAGSIQVNLVNPRTIGNLVFADQNAGTGAGLNWELMGSALTLDGGTPTITVNAMNPGGAAIINAPLAGTLGLTKAGAGQLTLGALGVHTFTGGINVDGGTLRYDDGVTVPVQAITIRNGATLTVPGSIAAAGAAGITVPASQTASVVMRNGGTIGTIGGGAGSTLNLSLETDGQMLLANGNWATGGSLGRLNITGIADGLPEYFGVRPNGGGGANNFVANSLQNTHVDLNGAVMFTRTNSGGNTITLGALSGNASSTLSGGGGGALGGGGTGSFATYVIGGLNTDTTFAGTIDVASAQPDAGTLLGGINLTKTGTGTFTLSGNLSGYQPTANGTANRRGGITTINGGTLKLTGSAVIPGGTGAGGFESTLRFQNNAKLDLTTATGPHSTQPFQNIIGVGTIMGAFTHDEGLLAPGDTLTGTTPTPVAAAGTMSFANGLSFAGNGQINFNLTSSTTTGNDLIAVTGVTSLTGSQTLNLSLIGGVTTGNYTIVSSTGGFGGTNASGWNVVWPGRGSAPTLSTSGTNLLLTVTPSNFANLRWSGAVDSTWVAGPPNNWFNTNTNAADAFVTNDNVTFGDTYGPGNTPVVNSSIIVDTTVSPLQMTFNSTTVQYSFSGFGKISGAASLVKTGGPTLFMQLANDFTGPASVSGAEGVDIGTFPTALGAGQLTLNNTKVITTAAGNFGNSSITLPTGTASELVANGGGILVLSSLAGDGNLLITSDTAGRQIDLSTNTDFTGDLTLGATGSPNQMIARLNGSSLPNTKLTLNNVSFRDRATSAQTQTFGALEGDASSEFQGYNGGSTSTGRTYLVGSLNTSTTFAGVVMDSINALDNPARYLNFTKIGTGTLTLTGLNTYSGTTRVEAGTLSITQAYLFDMSDVFIASGATLNLNTSSSVDVIDSLFLNLMSQQPGIYGAVGSGAQFETSLITGSGMLQVQTFVLQGDFDANNTVNDLDLGIWKTAAATGTAAGDADFDGDTDGTDLLIWQRNLGKSIPTVAVAGVVPEPASFALGAGALVALVAAGRRKRR